MPTIFELKEQAVTDTPLLVFDCVLPNGQTEHWSTHRVTVAGVTYEALVLKHNVFEIQMASTEGVDGIPRISIALANADSHFSEIERAQGWKGARLTVGFLFYDLRNDTALTDRSVVFQGICNPPDEIREATFRITATNRMNLQRLLLPQVRIQRRCPWDFPENDAQRTEAASGGASGKYSRFYPCGYTGAGFTSCGKTRGDCQSRGQSAHFGGIEYVPPAISVRTYGDKSWHTSAVSVNQARYNDFVPLVYGSAWYAPPVVFARNDGNLTRMEVLLGLGEMQGVLKVLVNNVEIPQGVAGINMTGTGWYNIPSLGTRDGTSNPDFPEGDPYGSMAYLSVVVPNRLNDGTSLPGVQVLVEGLKLPTFAADGSALGEQFTNNPAWVLLDVLRRAGWSASEIDLPSFAAAAAVCDEAIPALDIYGNAITLPRFGCNLVLKNRRSAGDLARGIRNAGRLLLTYGANGVLQARVENAAAVEQTSKPAWSNSTDSWSYEFGDGSNGFSGILRTANGEPSVRMFSRSLADTPNRFSVEFQDALNEYQQDSFSLVDADDAARSGQEVAATLPAIGIANYDQAGRVLKLNLDKSIRGNTYIEFDTSVKAFGVRAGDLITVTYLKEGFNRQPFRVLKLAPGENHRVTKVTAQIHDDAWYADTNGQTGSGSGGRRQGNAGVGTPRPLLGSMLDSNGDVQFGVEEADATASDGTVETQMTVSFVSPAVAGGDGPGIPMISLAAQVQAGGSLTAGQTLYYAVSAVDADGNESVLSFIVRATIASAGSEVKLTQLSFAPGTASFHVYRGSTPAQLFRIASSQAVAAEFIDTGLAKQLIAPPDPNYDHANFYWRMEMQPEFAVTVHSPNTIGNGTLEMPVNRWRGMIARITRGRGADEERAIVSNTATVLTVAPAWSLEPDATSFFVVAENGWKFGAMSTTSPVQFSVPTRSGEWAHLNGRAANVNDVESSGELSTVTRWQIGGGGASGAGVPPQPVFGLNAGPNGTVELRGVSFEDLTNTGSVTSGTLTLHYRDELQGVSTVLTAGSIAAGDTTINVSIVGPAVAGDFIQIEAEIVHVESVASGGTQYVVTRGLHGSTAAAHGNGTQVYKLVDKTVIAPFPTGFFGSPYSGSWAFPIPLPDVRIASAELFVTNRTGNSDTASINLSNNDAYGLRTLSGGQYSMQVSGYIAIDDTAAPPLVVEASHSVRDVYAVLGTAADDQVQLQLRVDGSPYCTLTFLTGMTVSDATDGAGLPPLLTGSRVTLAVESVGSTAPGADLTVLVRL